ncbi:hypothetical protein O3G_MSEX004652 [Manduca sexta]|uniref:Uncharacterized protein n=1 Tax=Manduca sexta TaxID=7130 RepID=A0A921YWZ5_MANSE|nr:hypothetical protein O3G_MSEX004652 [Manduca sexta]
MFLSTATARDVDVVVSGASTDNSLSLVYIEKELNPLECYEICGCDPAYIYNETLKECVLNMEYMIKALAQTSVEKSGHKYEAADHDIANDDGMAKNIRIEAEKIFQGIIISVIIFMVCASICIVTACVYCCHINYSDRQLKNNVKGVAKKLKKNYNPTRTVPRSKSLPKEESCNVLVGEARKTNVMS